MNRLIFVILALGLFVTVSSGELRSSQRSSSRSITVDADIRGTISREGQTQTYRLDIPVGTAVTITVEGITITSRTGPKLTIVDNSGDEIARVERVEGDRIDPKVAIVDRSGDEIASDDDSGEGNNARLTTVIGPRAYRVVVSGYSDNTGRYRLRIKEAHINEMEFPFNETAALTGEGTDFLLRFRVPSGRFIAEMKKMGDSEIDPHLRLIDEDGREIAVDDDGGNGTNARIQESSIEAGTYILIAKGFGSSTGDFEISAGTSASSGGSGEPTIMDVGRIGLGDKLQGRIFTAGDKNRYILSIPEGTMVNISVEKVSEDMDPKVEILDADGDILASDDDGGEGTNARLSTIIGSSARYLAVSAYESNTGLYDVSISVAQMMDEISVGDNERNEIRAAGEEHAYPVDVRDGSPVIITVDKDENSLDPKVRLLDRDGTELAKDDDSGDDNNARLVWILGSAVSRLVVSSYGTTTGEYRLEVSRARVRGLDIGDREEGRIKEEGEQHIYSIETRRTAKLVMRMEKIGDSEIDPYVYLVRSDGFEIAHDDDGGDGNDARLEQPSLQAGTYYIIVKSLGNGTGEFEIMVTAR